MGFNIRMGLPEMEALWKNLSSRKAQSTLDKGEEKLFKKLVKALSFLAADPKHTSLASHEIDDLSRKHKIKIFQSYLEIPRQEQGGSFGPTDLMVETLPYWPLSHIQKTKRKGPMRESSYQHCQPFKQRSRERNDPIASSKKP